MLQDQSASGITMPVPVLVALDDGSTIPIDQPLLLIGRSKRRAHVRINDPYVSSVHCEIHVEDGALHVRDCSRHGTRINGRMIDEAELLEGDILQIIKHRFRVETGTCGFEPPREELAEVPVSRDDPDRERFSSGRPKTPRRRSKPIVRDNWFIRMAGVELGPMPWSDVVDMAQSQEVTEADEVRQEFATEWKPAGSVRGLFTPDDDQPFAAASSDETPASETATWESAQPPVLDGVVLDRAAQIPAVPQPVAETGSMSPAGSMAPAMPSPAAGPPTDAAIAPLPIPVAPPVATPAAPTQIPAVPPTAAPMAQPAYHPGAPPVAPPVAMPPAQPVAQPSLAPTAPEAAVGSVPTPVAPVADAPPSLADSSSDVALVPPEFPGESLDQSGLSMPTQAPVVDGDDESADDVIDLDVSEDLSEADVANDHVSAKPSVSASRTESPRDVSLQLDYVPDPDNPRYFMRRKGRTFGPLEFQQLQKLADEGRLSQLDAIRTDANPDWVSASTVDSLFGDDSRDLSDEGYAASLLAEMDSSESGERPVNERPFIPEPETTVPSSEGSFTAHRPTDTTIPSAALATLPPLPVPRARDDAPRKMAVDVLAPLLYLQAMFQTWPRIAVAGVVGVLVIWMLVPTYSGSYVFGVVTLDGQPLKNSSITLTNPNAGIEVSGLVEDGEFVVTTINGGMPTGRYVVTCMPLERESAEVTKELQRQYQASQGVGGAIQLYRDLDADDPTGSGSRQPPGGRLPAGTIPFKYRTAFSSDIFVDVIEGRNEIKVTLQTPNG